MTSTEFASYLFGTSGLVVLVKELFNWMSSRKKNNSEIGSINAHSGKAYGDQAKAFAESVRISIEAKSMAEGIWKGYSEKLEQKILFLEQELHAEKKERTEEQLECNRITTDLQKQINELRKTN